MNKAALVCAAVLVGACSTQDPLIFISTNTVGIDVSGGPSTPLNVTFGYKGNDTSFVPVTALDKTGNVHEIRGCSAQGLGSGTVVPCPSQGVRDPRVTATGFQMQPVVGMRALPLPTQNGAESMRDALSVYSSFNTGVSAAGASAPTGTISLGKVFATGVAAQQLTQGQNYLMQRSAATQCIAQLVAAFGAGKVTEAALKTCD